MKQTRLFLALVTLLVLPLSIGVLSSNAADVPAQDAFVSATLYEGDVTISNTGVRLVHCTILGTLTVSQDVDMANCYVEGTVTNSAAITAVGCVFNDSGADVTDAGSGGSLTDTNCTFSTDCNLTGDNLPLNPDCWRITE